MGSSSPSRGEHKTYLKPPPRLVGAHLVDDDFWGYFISGGGSSHETPRKKLKKEGDRSPRGISWDVHGS